MYRIIFLVKRKPHLTHEQFREHFERSHAPLAQAHCGHLFTAYRRHYVDLALGGGDPRIEGGGYGVVEWGWDLISEWTVPDAASFVEITRIMATPEIKRLFEEDEDRFIDRTKGMMLPVATIDTGPAGGSFIESWDALPILPLLAATHEADPGG